MYRPGRRSDLDSGKIRQTGVFLENHGLAAAFLKVVQGPLLGFEWRHAGVA